MALTYSQAVTQMQDNADYDLVGSVAKAKLYVTAGRAILSGAVVRGANEQGKSMELRPEIIERQVEKAVRWLHKRGAMPGSKGFGVKRLDFSEFRE
ncbi:MAG: hypothetical protein AAF663_00090 [Planctomycetota bacterium]